MPHTFPFDLTTIVGPPAPPMFCSMAIGKTSKLGGHHRPCHGSIDPGLFDMGQCTAKRSECRIDSGSHKALKRIDDGTIIAYPYRTDFDDLHLFGSDPVSISQARQSFSRLPAS